LNRQKKAAWVFRLCIKRHDAAGGEVFVEHLET
jgi:hypothetical protein